MAEEKKTFSAFVIMPETKEEQRFCVVKDAEVKGGFEEGLFKAPGGGVEPGETTEEAAEKEVREETGQIITGRITKNPVKVLEIHKSSREEEGGTHIDVFFKSGPSLVKTPLKAGAEIAELAWKGKDEILEGIKSRKIFYPNHALAFILGALGIKNTDDPLLFGLLRRRGVKSWIKADDGIVVCFDSSCAACAPHRVTKKEEREEEGIVKNYELRLKGKVKFVIFKTDRWQDSVLLSEKSGEFFLPSAMADGETAKQLGVMPLRDNLIYTGTVVGRKNPIVVYRTEGDAGDLNEVSLNDHPRGSMAIPAEDAADICAAAAEYNKITPSKIKMHPRWRSCFIPRLPYRNK